tara:strand:+ start:276 stop:710 length:435 start_codon:yes stop_codon:yes gene_type:complete
MELSMPVPVSMSATTLGHGEANLSAGFPSPAEDHGENRIDLAEILVPHPSASFTLRVNGHSMTRAGIHDGDLAIVDRSLTARHNDVIVAALDGDLVCKRLVIKHGRTWLVPDCEDLAYKPAEVTGHDCFEIWGVITATIRFHRR